MVLVPDGAVAKRHLTGRVLAQEDASGNVQWFLADHEGSVRDVMGLVNGNWQVVSHITYTSFGAVLNHTGAMPRFAFAGRELDAETNLYYNRLRYYDAGTGRFLSEDPSGFRGGDYNLYRYVRNSPLNFIDPNGLWTEYIPIIGTIVNWWEDPPGSSVKDYQGQAVTKKDVKERGASLAGAVAKKCIADQTWLYIKDYAAPHLVRSAIEIVGPIIVASKCPHPIVVYSAVILAADGAINAYVTITKVVAIGEAGETAQQQYSVSHGGR